MSQAARHGGRGVRHIPFPEYPNVVGMHDFLCAGPMRTPWHSHPWAEINVLLEGHGTWCTEDGAFEVTPGDGFLILPGTRHRAVWPADIQFRTGTVGFLFEETSGLLQGSPGGGRHAGPPRARVTAWLFEALSLAPFHRLRWKRFPDWWRSLSDEQDTAQGPYRALRVESAMLEVLSRFADPAFWRAGAEQVERRGIGSALRHISETVAEGPVRVAELARIAGMSRSKFADLFHRTVGMPPHAYARALRMWMAQSALVGSPSSVASIADSLGFSSPQYFSRAFRAATGLTPQEYRYRWGAPWVKGEGDDDSAERSRRM